MEGFRLLNPQDRARIGEHENINITIHYLAPEGYKRIIKHQNAAFIKVHFKYLKLLPGDYITVSDPSRQQVYTYPDGSDFTTDGGDGFWALTVFADIVEIELHTSYRDQELISRDMDTFGVIIDKFARGYSMVEIQDSSYLPESVCGSDQRLDAACYQDSHSTEFSNSGAVAMHVYNGVGWCSAWRVGPGNFMFTNEHCLTSQAELNASEFWFGHQRLNCGTGWTQTPTIVTGNTFLQDDFLTDFALLTINDEHLVSEYGWLEIDNRLPVSGEEIYIPQQPGGLFPNDQRKVIAINSDVDSENVCRIDRAVVDGRWRNTDTSYMCDTSPGASGSPVLARSSQAVIGLHHLGGCRNKAVRMDNIWPLVSSHLIPGPDLINVSAPEQVEAGETFQVSIQAQNNKAASPEGLIYVSVGYSDNTHDLDIGGISSPWSDEILVLEPGQTPVLDNQCNEIPSGAIDHVLQSTDSNWGSGELHKLTFDVTPIRAGVILLRARNSMKDVQSGCNYHTDSELSGGSGIHEIDQGGWEVVRIEVEVIPKVQIGPLSIEKTTIDDDHQGASIGNGDGKIDCGEVVELGVDLINNGSTPVEGVRARLTSNQEGLVVLNDLIDYGDILPKSVSQGKAVIQISDNSLDDHTFQLDLETTAANGGPWNDLLELAAKCEGSSASGNVMNLYFPAINIGN